MATSVGDVANVTLQKLADAIISSLKRPDGTFYAAAPNAFVDRLQTTQSTLVPSTSQADKGSSEYSIEIRINPGGNSAWAKVVSHTPRGAQVCNGTIDLATLATKLV